MKTGRHSETPPRYVFLFNRTIFEFLEFSVKNELARETHRPVESEITDTSTAMAGNRDGDFEIFDNRDDSTVLVESRELAM